MSSADGAACAGAVYTGGQALIQPRDVAGSKRSQKAWSLEEDRTLRKMVRQKGPCWQLLADMDCWSERTVAMLKGRWQRLAKLPTQADGPEEETNLLGGLVDNGDAAGGRTEHVGSAIHVALAWAFDGARSSSEALDVVRSRRGMHPGVAAALSMGRMELGRHSGAGSQRLAHKGWCSGISRSSAQEARTELTPQHAKWVKLWRLSEGGGKTGWMLCHFDSAVKRLRKREQLKHPTWSATRVRVRCDNLRLSVEERDALKMTYVARDAQTLHTVLASGATSTWVCGAAAGEGHYVSACAIAAMMGYSTRSGVVWHARKLMSEAQLLSALGDSIYLPFAEALVRAALQRLRSEARAAPMAVYGSFYSGGIDAFAVALRRIHGSVDVAFVAEREACRREVLEAAHAPREVFSKVQEAGAEAPAATWVSWTSPCKMVTQALPVPTSERKRKRTEAASGVAKAAEALTEYVARHLPLVILAEQASGMATHNKQAHAEAQEALMRLPYACWSEVADAARSFGAPHRRNRLGWVLVRLDAVQGRVPRACVGDWWLRQGGCLSCGAGLAAGRCVIEECTSCDGAATSPPALPPPAPPTPIPPSP
jgi:hypothetical protein